MKSVTIFFLLFTISCKSPTSSDSSSTIMPFKSTPLETLKEVYKKRVKNVDNANLYFLSKNLNEILKTLEIVEEVEVQKDVVLIFYRYSVGTETVKFTSYMRKIDGLYMPYYEYYSTYDDDPFKNGKGEEAKALLKKAEKWEENESVWWAL